MATVIRFSRHGTKKKPYYRIVVQDKTAPRDGKFIEHIGAYDPIKGDQSLVVKRERLDYWLSAGAKMSDSVHNRVAILNRQGTQASATAEAPQAPKPKAKKAPKEKEA